jgi:hypothetical protein
MENLSLSSRAVLDTARCVDLAALWRVASTGLLYMSPSVDREGLRTALGRCRCLPSCRTKGFTASDNFESKLSVNALMWLTK